MDNTPCTLKIIASILFLLERAGKPLTQYQIVKAVFLADRSHLNEYGRPVTYDNYVAMEHGPVPSDTYGWLMNPQQMAQRHGIQTVPWESSARSSSPRTREFAPMQQYDAKELSPSDESALQEALSFVSSLDFNDLRRLTHKDPAWKAAWDTRGQSKGPGMEYSLLFDTQDDEQAEFVAFSSRHMECAT